MSTPIKTEHPHVVKVPGVRGGRPTIKGTRVAIDLIARFVKGGTDAAGILATYPHLTPAAVHDAISYYYDHQAEIDGWLEENTLEKVVARYGPPLTSMAEGRLRRLPPHRGRVVRRGSPPRGHHRLPSSIQPR